MDSRLVFLVVFVISSAVPYTKANGNITPLNYTFTRNDCGQNKLCVENPALCDPSGTSQCFFASTRINTIDSHLAIEFSGNSTGYIALAVGDQSDLSQGPHAVFVCGIDNDTVFLKTAGFENINNTLEERSFTSVSDIQYSLKNQSLIQCAFTIPFNLTSYNTINILGFNFKFNNTNIPVFLEVFHGSYNGGVFGEPMSAFGSSVSVNLADVNTSSATNSISTTTTPTTNTTTTPNTTNTTTTPNTTTTILSTTPNTTKTTTTPNTTNTTTTPNTTNTTTTPNTTATIPTTTPTTTPKAATTIKPTSNGNPLLLSHAALGLLAAVALRFV
ncbi:G8 domain-containing protein DDB_G0286311-like [Triplophysa dalaica]|uniref:G8 domain-containing protein DDB_G0286311-like n=1 Tax=Triplophysa dalaica TaxID=1582913 RepID=UPI0024DFBCAF|nr:G8 domain-containing protein DDB_G0286311-like [Triplophysa dalaica]